MESESGFPQWDASKPDHSLQHMYEWAIAKARERITWYEGKSKRKKTWSQLTRLAAVVLAALGVLCPLIDAIGLWTVDLGSWGYVFFALAAALYGFDKSFRLSKSWMRFIITQLTLERLVIEFQYDWAALLAEPSGKPSSPASDVVAMLQRVKDFSLAVETAIKQETDAWVAEFQSSLAELEQMLKTEVETRRPGSLKVTVSNAKDFDRVTVGLNGTRTKELLETTEGLIDIVPPGRYEVTVQGSKNSRKSRASKVVEVQAGRMAAVEIKLPAPSAKSKS